MELTYRIATLDDSKLLFRWVNDPLVRKNSFSTEQIDYSHHCEWLEKKLFNKNTLIIIFEDMSHCSLGQIRVDVNVDGVGIIDISIDPDFRGKGCASKMLSMLNKIVDENHQLLIPIRELVGEVKAENIASSKSFLNAGFERQKLSTQRETDLIRYVFKLDRESN